MCDTNIRIIKSNMKINSKAGLTGSLILTLLIQNELFLLISVSINKLGPGSSVRIATGYGLDGPGIESR